MNERNCARAEQHNTMTMTLCPRSVSSSPSGCPGRLDLSTGLPVREHVPAAVVADVEDRREPGVPAATAVCAMRESARPFHDIGHGWSSCFCTAIIISVSPGNGWQDDGAGRLALSGGGGGAGARCSGTEDCRERQAGVALLCFELWVWTGQLLAHVVKRRRCGSA